MFIFYEYLDSEIQVSVVEDEMKVDMEAVEVVIVIVMVVGVVVVLVVVDEVVLMIEEAMVTGETGEGLLVEDSATEEDVGVAEVDMVGHVMIMGEMVTFS